MICSLIKVGVLAGAGALLVGGAMFGTEACSYVTSSVRSVRDSVKSTVPIEFELRRARDMVDDIVPEMHAHIRLIAQEEVAIAQLKQDIENSNVAISDETNRIAKLRSNLNTSDVSFSFSGVNWSREQVAQDLARRFDWIKESKTVLAGKEKLLDNRERALAAATMMLEKTRSQKVLLEQQISQLESQNQLVKAAAVGSGVQIDNSKLAQTEKLIADIRGKLDVSERVLAHESKFIQPIDVSAVNERELVGQVDEFLSVKR